MIISKPIELNSVVTVKMVGGDEVVGKLLDERTDNYIELSKPLLVMMAQQGFGFVPYVLTAGPDCTVKLDARHVITYTKTYDEVRSVYIKQTTGIIT